MKLLVVDWDSFFPVPDVGKPDWQLYDWGHKESQFFITDVWVHRAATFLRFEKELPGLSGEQKNFWNRVKFNPKARLYYADSNACAVSPIVSDGVTEVLLLDAHHDSGYTGKPYTVKGLKALGREGRWSCDNWMVFYFLCDVPTEVWYPRWMDPERDSEPSLDLYNRGTDPGSLIEDVGRVFVCRSGAWVPPWLDKDFQQFIADCPAVSLTKPAVDIQPGGIQARESVLEDAEGVAELMRLMHTR